MVTVDIHGGLTIHGLTADDREFLKKTTTVKNPKYEQAKKYSKRNKVYYIPKTLEYFKEYSERTENGVRSKVLEVPIGLLNLFSDSESSDVLIRDFRQSVEQVYPNFIFDLRKDQEEAFKNYINKPLQNMIQLRTGKGKTILALYIAQYLKQRALILVHKDDLVVGWKKDIKDVFAGKAEVGLIKGKSDVIGKHITIATVQTLQRKDDEYMSRLTQKFGLVIIDECHHIASTSFNIIDRFNSKYKLGLTATPERSDGLECCFNMYLGGLCHESVFKADDEDLSKAEVIVKQGSAKFLPFVHDGVILNYYDYNRIGINDRYYSDIPYKERPRLSYMDIDNFVVSDSRTKIMVCKDIISEYKQGHNCVAFFTQKEHIRLYYQYLKRYIPKEKIQMFYGDNNESFSLIKSRAESGQCTVTLASYSKSNEGTNVTSWEVGFLVSSMNNKKNIEQCIGRVLRKKEGKLSPVRIYDYQHTDVYSFDKHFNTRLEVYDKFLFPVTGDIKRRHKRMLHV